MTKSSYSVVVIRKGREKDYSDFWIHDSKTNASGEDLHSDLVGFTVIVEANNNQEAVILIKKLHPGLSIDLESIQRIG